MKLKQLTTLLITLVAILAFTLIAPAGAAASAIIFGDAGWDSMKVHNAVAMLIAEKA